MNKSTIEKQYVTSYLLKVNHAFFKHPSWELGKPWAGKYTGYPHHHGMALVGANMYIHSKCLCNVNLRKKYSIKEE
jgi:hypothetical protein